MSNGNGNGNGHIDPANDGDDLGIDDGRLDSRRSTRR